jgi:hypothetical protein
MSTGEKPSPGLPPMVPRIPEMDLMSVNYISLLKKTGCKGNSFR